MNNRNVCINCHHIAYDKDSRPFCKLWSTYKDKTWIDWPDKQSCGTEKIDNWTGEFRDKKIHNRILKLKKLGI
jgi:hypothetical protein